MEPTKTDTLISRIVDDEATAQDWTEFEQLASLEPDVWAKLAREQRDAANLRRSVTAAIDIADSIELPLDIAGLGAERTFSGRFSPWVGWAMAAAVAMAWLGVNQITLFDNAHDPGLNVAGIPLTPASADEALDQYRTMGEQEGRYVGELPKVMVEARPMPDGLRIEILYLRQIVEREIVGGMYRFGEDDQGQTVPIQIDPTVIQASDPL